MALPQTGSLQLELSPNSYPSRDLWLTPMTEESIDGIKVNGRSYRKPAARTVVICFDGCDPRYISHGLSAGLLPNISKIMSEGFYAIADAAMPTFTNPNNMSIVTGAPPRVHGISGNYYLDKA